ncbi:MAG TPA: hypothetical protein VMW64_00975 [Dehalococcoidia bacterium]|nr:hypothetical protein [Dehalococcoidia bacterium]
MASAEIKIVIVLKENRASVGIQAPECDPIISTLEGDLVTVCGELPALVAQAEQKWSESPRFAKAVIVEPPASVPAVTATGGSPRAPKPAAPAVKPTWF